MRTAIALFVGLSMGACSSAKLIHVGDAMVRVERGSAAVVDGVSAAKDAAKQDCVARQLQTEAARAACVEDALEAVRGARTATQAVKAALVTFWSLYPTLEQKLASGERIDADDLRELARRADAVYAAYADLVVYATKDKP